MSPPPSLRKLTWNLCHPLFPFPPGNGAQCQESSRSMLHGSRRRQRSSNKIDADLLALSHRDLCCQDHQGWPMQKRAGFRADVHLVLGSKRASVRRHNKADIPEVILVCIYATRRYTTIDIASKSQSSAFLDFRVVRRPNEEAWFCRKTSLGVEIAFW
jgi:hypothetical protein